MALKTPHFKDKYIDELSGIDPFHNYFTRIWDELLASGIMPTNMLDIGCGTGVFSAYLRKLANVKTYGVDGSKYALGFAKTNGYQELQHISDFNYERLTWRNGTFDFCLCKDLLEHLVHPDNVVKEASRVLKPRGHILIHVPNHFPLFGRLKFLFTNDIDTFQYFPGAERWNFPHLRFFTKESLLDLAETSNLRLVRDLSDFFPALPGMGKMPFGRSIGRKFASRSPNQFAEAFTLLLEKNGSQ